MNENLYILTAKIDEDLRTGILTDSKKNELAQEIQKIVPKNSIALAQINPTPGDIKGNALKAKAWIDWAQKLELEAIVFPKMYLIGSPSGDFLNRFPIVAEENLEWLNALAAKSGKTKVVIGFVHRYNDEYVEATAVLSDGKIERIENGSTLENFEIGGKKVIVNCASTISRTKKEEQTHSFLSSIAKKEESAIIYVNQTGANECFSYEGSSRVYDSKGNLVFRAKSFEEQFFIVSPFEKNGKIFPLPNGVEKKHEEPKTFSLDYEADMERTYLTIVQSIKDYFAKTGFKRAVLGLSGGLDSTVSVVLLVDALGSQNVLGISMPSKITSSESKNDAQELAKNLGINFTEIPIKEMFDASRNTFDKVFCNAEQGINWDCRYKESFTNDNIQARSRAMILWGAANEFESCLPIATSDKSELYMGYATINGDMSGGFAPLADVTKTKLFALARWLNKNREQKNAIPESIIAKRPGAELAINPKTGKPLLAEEALMPYEFLDEIIWRVENLGQTVGDMLEVEFLYEKSMAVTTQAISKKQKLEWLEKFFRRMSTGYYKWTIMPPSPIVDSHSVNRWEYKIPIVASKINFHKTTFEQKLEELDICSKDEFSR